jgi:TrpR-related protein YerC/YecD
MKPREDTKTAQARRERSLYEAVATLRTVEDCQAFFRDLCTPAELQALADRWSAALLLRDGVAYRDVHQRTGVSVTTVGRVARTMRDGEGGYALAMDRIGKRNG